jgi:hypothetical protein
MPLEYSHVHQSCALQSLASLHQLYLQHGNCTRGIEAVGCIAYQGPEQRRVLLSPDTDTQNGSVPPSDPYVQSADWPSTAGASPQPRSTTSLYFARAAQSARFARFARDGRSKKKAHRRTADSRRRVRGCPDKAFDFFDCGRSLKQFGTFDDSRRRTFYEQRRRRTFYDRRRRRSFYDRRRRRTLFVPKSTICQQYTSYRIAATVNCRPSTSTNTTPPTAADVIWPSDVGQKTRTPDVYFDGWPWTAPTATQVISGVALTAVKGMARLADVNERLSVAQMTSAAHLHNWQVSILSSKSLTCPKSGGAFPRIRE